MTRLAVGAFRVDLDSLDSCMAALAMTEEELEGVAADLARRLAQVQQRWRGEAASAHRLAQSQWDIELGRLREALAAVRAAARHAHASYGSAVEANQAMWRHLG